MGAKEGSEHVARAAPNTVKAQCSPAVPEVTPSTSLISMQDFPPLFCESQASNGNHRRFVRFNELAQQRLKFLRPDGSRRLQSLSGLSYKVNRVALHHSPAYRSLKQRMHKAANVGLDCPGCWMVPKPIFHGKRFHLLNRNGAPCCDPPRKTVPGETREPGP